MAGEIKNFTGVDDPYEPPNRPEVHLRTDRGTPRNYAARVIRTAELLGHIPAGPLPEPVEDSELKGHLRRIGYTV